MYRTLHHTYQSCKHFLYSLNTVSHYLISTYIHDTINNLRRRHIASKNKNLVQWWSGSKDQCWLIYDFPNGKPLVKSVHYADKENPCEGIPVVKDRPDQQFNAEGKKLKTYYLTNKVMLIEIDKSFEQGKCTAQLAMYFELLVWRISHAGNWCGYSFVDELRAEALLVLMKYWNRFDATKGANGPNPFSYYTTFVQNSFKSTWARERRYYDIVDAHRVANGLEPSAGYSERMAATLEESETGE